MFYLAFEYFISYLPDVADRARCLAGCDIVEPSAASLDDQRFTAALIEQAAGKRLAERFL